MSFHSEGVELEQRIRNRAHPPFGQDPIEPSSGTERLAMQHAIGKGTGK